MSPKLTRRSHFAFSSCSNPNICPLQGEVMTFYLMVKLNRHLLVLQWFCSPPPCFGLPKILEVYSNICASSLIYKRKWEARMLVDLRDHFAMQVLGPLWCQSPWEAQENWDEQSEKNPQGVRGVPWASQCWETLHCSSPFIYFFNAIKHLLSWFSHYIFTHIVFFILKVLLNTPSNMHPVSRQAFSIRAEGPEMPSAPLEEPVKSFSLWKECMGTVAVDISMKLLGWQILRSRKAVHSREISEHGLGAIVPNIPCVSLWS